MNEKDVNYDIVVIGDELPADEKTVRASVLRDQVAKVVASPSLHRKWLRIGDYGGKNGAQGAAATLRFRHGDHPEIAGWSFKTKRTSAEDGSPRAHLLARYDPEQIVDGAREAFEKKMKDKELKAAARRAEKKAAVREAAGE